MQAFPHKECAAAISSFAAEESGPHFSFRHAEKKNRRRSGEKEKGAGRQAAPLPPLAANTGVE